MVLYCMIKFIKYLYFTGNLNSKVCVLLRCLQMFFNVLGGRKGIVQGPSTLKTDKKAIRKTARERGHPHTGPARQLRRGVEPRLTQKDKIKRLKTKGNNSTTNKGDRQD